MASLIHLNELPQGHKQTRFNSKKSTKQKLSTTNQRKVRSQPNLTQTVTGKLNARKHIIHRK